jgi:hypothetical protein
MMLALFCHWRAIGFAAALVGAFWVGWAWQGAIAAQKASALVAAQQAAQIAQTKRILADVDTLAQNFEADRAALAADRDAAAAAVRGLRAALAHRAGLDPATASGGDGGPIGRALEQCAERYSELAGIADGYANQLIALQAYVGAVTQ